MAVRSRASPWLAYAGGLEVPSSNLGAPISRKPYSWDFSAFERRVSGVSHYGSISGIARSAAATQLHATRSACSIRAM